MRKIDPDANRFRKIVRGKIRENLKQYVSQGELIARQGKKSVSVPLPQIDLPNFRFGEAEQGELGRVRVKMVTPSVPNRQRRAPKLAISQGSMYLR